MRGAGRFFRVPGLSPRNLALAATDEAIVGCASRRITAVRDETVEYDRQVWSKKKGPRGARKVTGGFFVAVLSCGHEVRERPEPGQKGGRPVALVVGEHRRCVACGPVARKG